MLTLAALAEARVVAVLRSPSPDEALRVVDSLVEAGITAVELTTSTPGWDEALSQLAGRRGLVVGLGTVRSPADARLGAELGARFLVSPGSPPALVTAMLETGVLALPGCLTPTEVLAAQALGAQAVKLFPAFVLGVRGLRGLREPIPDVPIVVTGGITPDAVGEWLAAGAYAVGLGGALTASPREAARVALESAAGVAGR